VKAPAVHILVSQRNGTLYTGVTSDLIKRVWEHKNNLTEGFTRRYHTHRLVYYEQHPNMVSAIVREKQIKKWYRQWKLQLIEERNPAGMICINPCYKKTGFPLSPQGHFVTSFGRAGMTS